MDNKDDPDNSNLTMKTAVLTVALVALGSAAMIPAQAGDREWATAGKVLTGVAVAGVLTDAFRPHYAPPVVYSPVPAPTVIYAAPPTVVYATPAPVVYVAAPAYCGRPVVYGSPWHHQYGYHAHGPFVRRW